MRSIEHAMPYAIGFTFPMLACSTMLGLSSLAWAIPIIAFILIPILDQVFPHSSENLSEEEEEILQKSVLHSVWLFLMLPIQWGLVFLLCWKIERG